MLIEQFNYNSNRYNLKNASILAALSKIIYEEWDKVASQVKHMGFHSFKYFEKEETEAIVATTPNFVAIIFRGTESFQDAKYDMDIRKKETVFGDVHYGFNKALDKIWPDIIEYLDVNDYKRNIFLSGHSLGAALATVATLRMVFNENYLLNSLYTYGSPRVLAPDAAKKFDSEFKLQTYRHVNNNDAVVKIPHPLRFRHIGVEKYFDADGILLNHVPLWRRIFDMFEGGFQDLFKVGLDGIKDHYMNNYINVIQRHVEDFIKRSNIEGSGLV